ncbi:amino acid ABC transporter permease [Agrobacterium tumefaciens]|uniref:amino acid ABC transporter permease n=1 Tax=Agrobacterium tumefaciens TaxID=358 RepID=UPI0012B78D04|nr:amino acid ABC transporter permease [Agrobacterium tumefaciens]MQB07305.1 amino acid ABC transporter permease [Agrobacterium tumefaciens]
MTQTSLITAFSRSEEAPCLPPPARITGVVYALRRNYFSSVGSGVVTIILGVLLIWLAWQMSSFALIRAVWTGDTREACLAPAGTEVGACWPFVSEKIGQWVYGFFPIDERWRVNLMFLIFTAGLVPMLTPSIGGKRWNAFFMLAVFPVLAFILLTGGDVGMTLAGCLTLICLWAAGITFVPLVVLGGLQGWDRNRVGVGFFGAGVLLMCLALVLEAGPLFFGVPLDVVIPLLLAGLWSLMLCLRDPALRTSKALRTWMVIGIFVLTAAFALGFDFGLTPVETTQWGGLTLTLVVSVTGIGTSLPLGILLALGRQSSMPAVRTLSVTFIEVVRGVPLITVLFMASVMLPLFLPPGVNFDKLLRALVGVTLFSSAYMAEVVRGGLQAVPRGQLEGAMALGLGYWQTMIRIILPQALKISIPNIVGNFIVLFKDTTLVLIIGLFDLLAIAQTGLRDAAWATPVTAPTGYLVIALIYWAFCFSMSRYARFTEQRLHTGHRK